MLTSLSSSPGGEHPIQGEGCGEGHRERLRLKGCVCVRTPTGLNCVPHALVGEGAIGCMADTIAQVIDDYSEDWSSDGHFGASRSRASGRSRSLTSSRSDVTLTKELLARRETLEDDLEEMADDSTGLEKTSVSSAISERSQVISYPSESTEASSSALSTDLEDSTSTQKEKEEAMKEEVRKSGERKRGNNKDQKKNKVAPLGNDSTVAADEPKKKQALLPRITAALAKLFCFPCKKRCKK
ncbi:hypothetical protein J4Q44_G00286100 [Coregonus suidteri]|uniref:Uncharacterized protein n=1 Tax=Coregonus suidteri TaxID=861788 RepID=A0AAN8KX49_9TELE